MLYIYGAPTVHENGHETAYALLEYAYGRLAGGAMPPIVRTELGKPYFLRSHLEFSLSHTKTMAFCAISNHPIGIDAETVRPVRGGVAERTMNPGELAWMAEQPDADRAFLQLWTMKEAWAKLSGKGLNGRPQEIVLLWKNGAASVEGEKARFQTREVEQVMVSVCTPYHEQADWTVLQALPPASREAQACLP